MVHTRYQILLGSFWQTVRSSLTLAWPAVVGFIGIRAVNLLVLGIVAAERKVNLWYLLHSRFDALWYVGIAVNGYDSEFPALGDNGKPRNSNLAFFPLYPALIRLVTWVTGVPAAWSALSLSWIASVAAAWGLFAIGHHLYGRRSGVILACLWSALPHGIVLSMGYTEGIFTALAAWALLAVLRERWIAAGTLCFFAGLVRPTSAALIAAVGVTAALAIWQQRRVLRPAVAMLMSPIGLVGYFTWVGHRIGSPTGYFEVQKAWGSPFDGGRFTLEFLQKLVLSKEKHLLAVYVVAAAILVALFLFMWSVLEKQPLPLLVYSFVFLVLTIGTGGFFHSKARLMLPTFPLLLPVANMISALKPRSVRLLFLGFFTLVSVAFSLHLRLAWRWSP